MNSSTQNKTSSDSSEKSKKPDGFSRLVGISLLSLMTLTVFSRVVGWNGRSPFLDDPRWENFTPAPLVMQGGDPHIRALMRTISASESNVPQPYSVLYGGTQFKDFSQHPDTCVTITVGPNTGNCSTAAGRYQFITTTWLEQAQKYHPNPDGLWLWQSYSFMPEYQDKVVYAWLSDSYAWGTDLTELLRRGEVTEVLRILSPTWTSLGYGIESNSMSDALPQIYEEVLQEELQTAQ